MFRVKRHGMAFREDLLLVKAFEPEWNECSGLACALRRRVPAIVAPHITSAILRAHEAGSRFRSEKLS